MDDLSVIDDFLTTFSNFIDSGFGLLGPDVRFLANSLIVIDLTLAGLFWAMADNTNVIAQFLKKVLYIGFFAFIIGNFSFLSGIIFDTFAGLGLRAGGSTISQEDLMRPGFVAATGFAAAAPILAEIGDLTGPVAFFVNIVTIGILAFSWGVVLLAFFILAVQLFITILEFKLTALAGFILVPFALWNKTTFLAERVLGSVVTSGVKLMVLSMIVAIGSTVFSGLSSTFAGGDINVSQALSMVLASISIFGLGIFGPGIATGLITGAPQLGAGAVGASGRLAVGALKGVSSAVKAGASLAGGASSAFQLGKAAAGKGGLAGAAAGASGIAQAGTGVVSSAIDNKIASAGNALKTSYARGSARGFTATGGSSSGGSAANAAKSVETPANDNPDWSGRFQPRQSVQNASQVAAQTLRDGDSSSGGATPSLQDRDDQ